jgi:hypothetical protein
MGLLYAILAVLGLIVVAAVIIGQLAIAIVMAGFACLMGGLTGALGGLVIGTNVFKMDYETAFRRWFVGGAFVAATAVMSWTAALDLLDGGLFNSIATNLGYVTFRMAVATFVVACACMGTWAYIVFSKPKLDPPPPVQKDKQP